MRYFNYPRWLVTEIFNVARIENNDLKLTKKFATEKAAMLSLYIFDMLYEAIIFLTRYENHYRFSGTFSHILTYIAVTTIRRNAATIKVAASNARRYRHDPNNRQLACRFKTNVESILCVPTIHEYRIERL